MSWVAYETVLINVCIAALLAASVQVVLRAGVLSLASIGFAAVGAYATGIVAKDHAPPWFLAAFAGVLIAGAAATLTGLAVRRLRGLSLALASVAIVLVIQAAVVNMGQLTGGAIGLVGIGREVGLTELAVAVVAVALALSFLERRRPGRVADAVREDEIVARSMGIDVERVRLTAFAISGLLAGLSGALSALQVGFVAPSSFGFSGLVQAVAVAVVGGVASWRGAYLGAVLIIGLPGVVDSLDAWREVFFGGALIVTMVFEPRGLLGMASRFARGTRNLLSRRSGEAAAAALLLTGGSGSESASST